MLRAGRYRLSPSDTLSLNKAILIAVLSSGNAQVFAFRNLKRTVAASVKSCVCKSLTVFASMKSHNIPATCVGNMNRL